jgi:hypothetical protein
VDGRTVDGSVSYAENTSRVQFGVTQL